MSAVVLQREGRLARLTLDRPPLNILDMATMAEIEARLEELGREPQPQLVVLTGAGGAFSAGAAVEDHVPERVAAMLERFHGAIRRLRSLEGTTLAVVRGHCLGGGLELAAACDLVLADDDARFGQPEVKLGCLPPVAAALYPRRLGRGRALELLLTGRNLDAAEAERLGLVTWRVAAAELEAKVAELTEALLSVSAPVAKIIKRAVEAGASRPFDEALAEAERLYLEELAATHDMKEGIAAFQEKRPPCWRHE